MCLCIHRSYMCLWNVSQASRPNYLLSSSTATITAVCFALDRYNGDCYSEHCTRIVIQYLQVHCIIYRGKKIQSVFSGKKSAEKYHFCKVPAKVSGQFHAINMYRSIRKK
jgi:hypothetical protein